MSSKFYLNIKIFPLNNHVCIYFAYAFCFLFSVSIFPRYAYVSFHIIIFYFVW